MAGERGGVGTRLYVAGGQEAKHDFAEFGNDGKRAFNEIGAAARSANPGLLVMSRGVGVVKDDVKGLAAEAGAAGRYLGAFGATGLVAAAGVAGFGIALTKARESLDFADEIGDTANRLKVSAEGLQEWRFAAQDAGLEASAFEQSITGLASSLGKAQSGLKGSKGVVDAFSLLGIDKDQLDGIKRVEDALPLIAEGLKNVGSEAERAAIADRLGVRALLPLLEQGADKISDLRDEAHKLGLVLDNETIAQMGDMQRQVEVASQVLDVQLKQSFLNLSPVLLALATDFGKFARGLNDFLESFKKVGDRSSMALEDEQQALAKRMDNLRASGGADAPAGRSLMAALEARQIAGADALASMRQINQTGDLGLGNPGLVRLPTTARSRATKDTRTTLGKLIDIPVSTAFDIATGNRLSPESVQDAADKESALGPTVLAKKVLLDVQLKEGLSEQLQPQFDKMQQGVKGAFSDGLHAALNGDFMEYFKSRLMEASIDGLAGLGASLFKGMSGGGGFWGTVGSALTSVFVRHGAGGPEQAGVMSTHGEYGMELAAYGRNGQVFDHDSTVRMLRSVANDGGSRQQSGGAVFNISLDARGAGPREVDALKARLDQLQAAVPEMISVQAGPAAHAWMQDQHVLARQF